MQIWVDADACPRRVKEILFRAAERVGITTTLVANQPLRIPQSAHINALQVPGGPDVADEEIVKQMQPGDLVITADIPLAAAVVEKSGTALNPRGKLYTTDNIGEALAMRNLLDELRSSGIQTSGPPQLSKKDLELFANELDKFLRRHK